VAANLGPVNILEVLSEVSRSPTIHASPRRENPSRTTTATAADLINKHQPIRPGFNNRVMWTEP